MFQRFSGYLSFRYLIAAVLASCLCASGIFPGGTPPIAVPAPASATGYNVLAFNQDANSGFDFDSTGTGSGHMWYNGLWQSIYDVSAGNFSYTDGDLVMKWTSAQIICTGGGYGTCPIAIISTGNNTLTSYRAFGHGYFEMIARVVPLASGVPRSDTSPGHWIGFWLLGLTTGQQCLANGFARRPYLASPAPNYSELDAVESQSSKNANVGYESYHYGTGIPGCGGTDGMPQSALLQNEAPVTGFNWSSFHKYGLLWQDGTLTYYIDDIREYSVPTSAVTEAQLHTMQAWMAEGCAFRANNQSCLTDGVNEFDLHIQSIRQWSCTATLANQLAC